MSDSNESGITYKEVSSPFKGLSDIRSPRADDQEYLELPGMPEDPYVVPLSGPHPLQISCLALRIIEAHFARLCSKPQAHTDDEIVADGLARGVEGCLTQLSVTDYDHVDYPPDGGDDSDNEEGSSEDDEDDDMDIEANDEEEEEHLAPANSVVVALPATDQAPSAEETEPFETDESAATPPPHPAYRCQTSSPISTPPSSPLSPWSSPLPQIPSPSLPLSPPSPVLSPAPPPSPIRSLGYRAAMIRMRAEAASTSHSLPLPPPFILSPTRPDAPSLGIPPLAHIKIAHLAAARPAGGLRADYGFVATMDREIRRDPEREVGYGITDSWDEIVETLQGAPSQRQYWLGQLNNVIRTDEHMIYTFIRWRRGISGHATTDIDSDAVITGTCVTRIGDHTTRIGYRTTRRAGTRWRSCTARAARGGW
ncbi:hypothetical protein Tco_1316898 [Tanacetum coccineum]